MYSALLKVIIVLFALPCEHYPADSLVNVPILSVITSLYAGVFGSHSFWIVLKLIDCKQEILATGVCDI